VFIKDMPKESTPLCKGHRDNPDLIEQFEPYANGWELGNAYTELNDPVRQRELLEEQVNRGRGGEDETHPMDENFLDAIESGLPPTGGVGFGIDRMVMLLTNQQTIRDVQLFPLMKSE
jgi:lysyl-tRNA synthetase class 2